MNVNAMAEDLGLKSFDTSLPISWTREVWNKFYDGSPSGHIVWCYDDFSDGSMNIFGYPVALTLEGREVLGKKAIGM